MTKHSTDSKSWESTVIKHTAQLAGWTISWVLTTALVAFGPKFIWDFNPTLSILALVLNVVIGIFMILANRKHLKSLDELMQKIQLNAMAIALGVGLVFGIAYDLMEDIKLITFEPEISHLVMVMAFAYMISVVVSNRNYK